MREDPDTVQIRCIGPVSPCTGPVFGYFLPRTGKQQSIPNRIRGFCVLAVYIFAESPLPWLIVLLAAAIAITITIVITIAIAILFPFALLLQPVFSLFLFPFCRGILSPPANLCLFFFLLSLLRDLHGLRFFVVFASLWSPFLRGLQFFVVFASSQSSLLSSLRFFVVFTSSWCPLLRGLQFFVVSAS